MVVYLNSTTSLKIFRTRLTEHLETNCFKTLDKKIYELSSLADKSLQIILTSKFSQAEINDFFSNFYNVKSFEKKMRNFFLKTKRETIERLSNVLYVFKDKIDEKLEEIMNEYISKNGGFEVIGKLGVLLKKDAMGSMILSGRILCFVI